METSFVLSVDTVLEWLENFVKGAKVPLWLQITVAKLSQMRGKKVEIIIRAVDK